MYPICGTEETLGEMLLSQKKLNRITFQEILLLSCELELEGKIGY